MREFIRTKKGFTITELLVTLVLLGLGVFALVSLISAGTRAFTKTAERYEKQEMVKYVAERLQNGTNVCSATSATIFDNLDILPKAGEIDTSYSYLYILPVFQEADGTQTVYVNPNGTVDASKMIGYNLYTLNKGVARPTEESPINGTVPLYLNIKSDYTETKDANGNVIKKDNLPGIIVSISALENDAEYKVSSSTTAQGYLLPEDDDSIFYTLNVGYHFPNMVSQDGIIVNCSSGQKNDNGDYIYDKALLNNSNISTATPDSVLCSTNGIVLRLTSDSQIFGDTTSAKTTTTSFCFIATASYGADSGEVGLLCDFRDNILLKTDLGKAFVKAYYTVSPSIADIIRDSEPLKAIVRFSLKPLVIVATYALTPELLKEQLPIIITFAVAGLALSATLVHLDKKKRKSIR